MDDGLGYSFPVRHKNFSVHVKNFKYSGEKVDFGLGLYRKLQVYNLYADVTFTESKTDIVMCSHDDQILVIATQIGTMGTILHARKEEGMLNNPTFNVSVLFGKRDEPMLLACARQLIEHMSNSGSSKQLTLSLGLKDHSMETLKGIVSAVIENRLW